MSQCGVCYKGNTGALRTLGFDDVCFMSQSTWPFVIYKCQMYNYIHAGKDDSIIYIEITISTRIDTSKPNITWRTLSVTYSTCIYNMLLTPKNKHLSNALSMLGRRRIRWTNIKPVLVQRLAFAGELYGVVFFNMIARAWN